jgi:UDP-glucose 4-epimerase
MKKILITGCNGYIGLHLAKLLKNDYEVYGIDNTMPFNTTNMINVDIRSELKEYEFTLNDLPWEYDTVVHLAALVKVNESVTKPIQYYNTNLFGTINVLKKLQYKNFVFASTGTAANPINPYALSKRVCEDLIREHCLEADVPYTIFRFYNVIGTDGIPPTNPDGLFYNLLKAEETGVFRLYGDDYNTKDGSAVRDYVHVNEICMAIELALERPSCVPGAEIQPYVENLGHGCGHTVKEIITTYKAVNNCNFEIEVLPRRPGDLEYSVLNDVSPYMKQFYTFEELMKR